jgi:hypothetical protein
MSCLFLFFFSPLHCTDYHVLLLITLGYNSLTGSIPNEIGLLASLKTLDLCK